MELSGNPNVRKPLISRIFPMPKLALCPPSQLCPWGFPKSEFCDFRVMERNVLEYGIEVEYRNVGLVYYNTNSVII